MSTLTNQVFLASWFDGTRNDPAAPSSDHDFPAAQAVVFRGSPKRGDKWIRIFNRGHVEERFQPTVCVRDLRELGRALREEREERRRAGPAAPVVGTMYEIPVVFADLLFPGMPTSTSEEHIQRLTADRREGNVDIEGAEAERERTRKLLDRLRAHYEARQIPPANLKRSDG